MVSHPRGGCSGNDDALFRFFDTRSHSNRSRQTSMCENLPDALKGEDGEMGITPTIPAFVNNDDSYNLLQHQGIDSPVSSKALLSFVQDSRNNPTSNIRRTA